MGKTVRVPEPVYERIEREADREDINRGDVVRDWMKKADRYDDLEIRGRDL